MLKNVFRFPLPSHKQKKTPVRDWCFLLLVAGAGIEPASGGSFTPTISSRNGLYHNPIGILPL